MCLDELIRCSVTFWSLFVPVNTHSQGPFLYSCGGLSRSLVQDGGVVLVSRQTSTQIVSFPVRDSPLSRLQRQEPRQVRQTSSPTAPDERMAACHSPGRWPGAVLGLRSRWCWPCCSPSSRTPWWWEFSGHMGPAAGGGESDGPFSGGGSLPLSKCTCRTACGGVHQARWTALHSSITVQHFTLFNSNLSPVGSFFPPYCLLHFSISVCLNTQIWNVALCDATMAPWFK